MAEKDFDGYETVATIAQDIPVEPYIASWLKTIEAITKEHGPIPTARLILTVGKTIRFDGADTPTDDPLTVRVEFKNVGDDAIKQVTADIADWAKDKSRQNKTPLKTAVIDASLD